MAASQFERKWFRTGVGMRVKTRVQGQSLGDGLALAPALLLVVMSLLFFSIRNWNGLWFPAFGDELEHLLGGKVLNAGGVLYRTYVDSHGPVTFVLTEFYGAVFGWSHANSARLISTGFALLASMFVATSPALPNTMTRLWATNLFLGLIAAVWLTQGLYLVSYYPIAGSLVTVGLVSFVVASWRGSRISNLLALGAVAEVVEIQGGVVSG